jgi:Recombinase
MAPVRRETSPGRSETQGASANKRAADLRALVLLPTIRELMAAGFASERGLANELNRRGITGARAGRWHRSSVRRMLTRLRQLTSKRGGTDNNLAWKRVADLRAEALRPTIYNLRKAGFVSICAIARELNKRGIPTARGGKWHMTTVTRLLERLDRLDRVSLSRRRR